MDTKLLARSVRNQKRKADFNQIQHRKLKRKFDYLLAAYKELASKTQQQDDPQVKRVIEAVVGVSR
jgi:hypothetical protein